jgi:hypothetical protein
MLNRLLKKANHMRIITGNGRRKATNSHAFKSGKDVYAIREGVPEDTAASSPAGLEAGESIPHMKNSCQLCIYPPPQVIIALQIYRNVCRVTTWPGYYSCIVTKALTEYST